MGFYSNLALELRDEEEKKEKEARLAEAQSAHKPETLLMVTPLAAPEPVCIFRIKEVVRRVGLSRSTIYMRMKNGSFPESIRLGENSVGWLSRSINDWIAARVADSEANHTSSDTSAERKSPAGNSGKAGNNE